MSQRVMAIISKWSGSQLVDGDSDLVTDLGLDGDNVDGLFNDLIETFGWLPCGDVRWDRHFEMNEPPFYLDALGTKQRRFEQQRIPIRARHLVEWIENKRWPIRYDDQDSQQKDCPS